jgi:hypothetical protein
MTEQDKGVVRKWAVLALCFSLIVLLLVPLVVRDKDAFGRHVVLPVFLAVAVLGTAYRCHRHGVVSELRRLKALVTSPEAREWFDWFTEPRFWRKSFWKPPRRKDG